MNALDAMRRALGEYPGRNPQQLQARKVCEGVLALAATLAQQQGGEQEARAVDARDAVDPEMYESAQRLLAAFTPAYREAIRAALTAALRPCDRTPTSEGGGHG